MERGPIRRWSRSKKICILSSSGWVSQCVLPAENLLKNTDLQQWFFSCHARIREHPCAKMSPFRVETTACGEPDVNVLSLRKTASTVLLSVLSIVKTSPLARAQGKLTNLPWCVLQHLENAQWSLGKKANSQCGPQREPFVLKKNRLKPLVWGHPSKRGHLWWGKETTPFAWRDQLIMPGCS